MMSYISMLKNALNILPSSFKAFCTAKTSSVIKITPLHSLQVSLNAKMTIFNGYELPLHFDGILEEHHHCRTHSSLFDISHLAQFEVYGQERASFLESLSVIDLNEVKLNNSIVSAFTNEKGGIIDIFTVTNKEESLSLVVNSACSEKDYSLLMKHSQSDEWKGKDLKIVKVEGRSLISLQGPKSAKVLQPLISGNLSNLGFLESATLEIPGINEFVFISRRGYTGKESLKKARMVLKFQFLIRMQ
jgi:aminomethyltransferase